jgi:ABC-type polysaccharide/polyol phosphate export permease
MIPSRNRQKEKLRREAVADGRLLITAKNRQVASVCHDIIVLKHDFTLVLWRAWQDLKARYRRSILGPYWLSIGTFTFVLGYSFLAGILFGRPLQDFLGYIAAGVITWQFIATSMIEGSKIFVSNAQEISSSRVNLLSLPLKLILRGLIGFAHSLPVVLVVVYFTDNVNYYTLMLVPGLLLIAFTLFPLIIMFGTLAARFRDIEQVVAMVIQFSFYMTPIIWKTGSLGTGNGRWISKLNPFYYELSIVRGPLLGQAVDWQIWAGAFAFMVVSMLVGFLTYARFRQRIPFWI